MYLKGVQRKENFKMTFIIDLLEQLFQMGSGLFEEVINVISGIFPNLAQFLQGFLQGLL